MTCLTQNQPPGLIVCSSTKTNFLTEKKIDKILENPKEDSPLQCMILVSALLSRLICCSFSTEWTDKSTNKQLPICSDDY